MKMKMSKSRLLRVVLQVPFVLFVVGFVIAPVKLTWPMVLAIILVVLFYFSLYLFECARTKKESDDDGGE